MAPSKRSREEWNQEIISNLVQQKALGETSVSIKKLKTLCQYPGGEASFKNNIVSKLKSQKNVIEYPEPGHVGLTESGIAFAEESGLAAKAHTTNEEVQEHFKETMLTRKSHLEIFEFLVKDGKPHTFAECANSCSTTCDAASASFNNNIICKMRSSGLLEDVDKSGKSRAERTVQLTDMCFPFGRP
ncbi:MAG: hypothetical protein SGARI_002785 [Bacillariaceae sp.]